MRACPQCNGLCDETHKFCPACAFPISKVQFSADDPMIGRSLPGGYVILDLVGVGGMGRVYRAEQTNLNRTVAVKIIHPHLVGEEKAAARFITEARAASRLNHTNSVGVIDFGKTSDGQLYLVMEFLRGRHLARVMSDEGPLAFRRIVDILKQVLAALAEAHHLEIIHRDLKPENIIIEPNRSGDDFVKVVDFGLAKMRLEATQPHITSPGSVCGTPEYMSPEQGRGDPLDARSDLYAVGVIFYQLLTGRLPFEAESPTQVVLMHISDAPPDPKRVAPERNLPTSLVDVCLMSLAKHANHRFSNADEFAAALTDALAQSEMPASPALLQVDTVRPRSATQTQCPACKATNAANQKFCGECGQSLIGGPAPPTMVLPTAAPALAQEAPSAEARSSTQRGLAEKVRRAGSYNEVGFKVDVPHPPPPPNRVKLVEIQDRIFGKERATGKVPRRNPDEPTLRPATGLGLPLELMGRAEELAWLGDRLRDTTRSLIAARIVGEPGTGKTRLLSEFTTVARQQGNFVVPARPDPAWAGVTCHALASAIRELAAFPASGPPPREFPHANKDAIRGMTEIFGLPREGAAMTPEEHRYAVAEALRWSLLRAARREPAKKILIVVDDLHAVDGASRLAFGDVVGEPARVPALLVAAYPPGFDPGWPATTAAARILGGIAMDDVTRLLTDARAPSSAALAGNRGIAPLYVDQLIRFGEEQGGVPPPRLGDLIALRTERLDQDARKVLQAIAVYGDAATELIVSRMVTRTIDVPGAARVLVNAGMVERSGDMLAITHPLLREVVLATIPQAVRRDLHAMAAEVCEEAEAPIEVRALHEYHAENAFQALILLEQVSAKAVGCGDTDASIDALRRGLDLARLELVRGDLDEPLRAVLIFSRKLGEALTGVGQFTDAEGILREALHLAGPTGEDRARILGALAKVCSGRDRPQEAHTYLREALELAFESGAHDLLFSLEGLKKTIAV